MDLTEAKKLIKMVKGEKPSLVIGCALCDTWRDTNRKTIDAAIREAFDAGWRSYKEGSICSNCRGIRKQAFLEVVEMAENYETWNENILKFAKLLREKAEE